ncbi:MAG: acetyl-CoA hydrolase/transferase C-terminal domain-containing protein [Gemmobacter sp.]|nr:acetyl-CoA hydrolase/transferase C-terminal domain-containing protein [Gemmobacter sp.]
MTLGNVPLSAISARLHPGARVFLPGSAAEVRALTGMLTAPDAVALHLTATLVPGINAMPALPLAPGATLTNPFAFGPAGSQAKGAARHVPATYAGFAKHIARATFDAVIVTVAPPGPDGRASLGPAVEFTPTALARTGRMIVVINHALPAMPDAPTVALRDAELVVETDSPLCAYDAGVATPEALAIAGGIAAFITDGATVQIGIGKVPDALLRALTDRRGLRLHSGMLSDGMQALAAAGALDPHHLPTSCVHVGTQAHYDWVRGRAGLIVAPVSQTHAPGTLAAQPRLVAVNGAIEVDLFGQANLETIGPRAISGVGGAGDFAAAAARAPDGISIVGLPAVGPKGVARIVPQLTGPVSLPRHEVDVVVTEFGSADLRGLCSMARAERIMAIAAPDHRAALSSAWHDIAAKL